MIKIKQIILSEINDNMKAGLENKVLNSKWKFDSGIDS